MINVEDKMILIGIGSIVDVQIPLKVSATSINAPTEDHKRKPSAVIAPNFAS